MHLNNQEVQDTYWIHQMFSLYWLFCLAVSELLELSGAKDDQSGNDSNKLKLSQYPIYMCISLQNSVVWNGVYCLVQLQAYILQLHKNWTES